MKYENNKTVSILLATIPIKSLLEGTKVLCSLIALSIKESKCSDAWKFVTHHFANGSSHIQGVDFYQSCSPVGHADSFRINISMADMHRLNASILDVSNEFHNKHFPINKKFVSFYHPII